MSLHKHLNAEDEVASMIFEQDPYKGPYWKIARSLFNNGKSRRGGIKCDDCIDALAWKYLQEIGVVH